MLAIQQSHGRLHAAAPTRSVRAARCSHTLVVAMHGHGHGHGAKSGTATMTEKDRGFVAEMRKVAMKLHTKDQAPKEGGQETPKPQQAWAPTREGYLRFLTESKVVYDAFDQLVKDQKHPEYALLQNTGLERAAGLSKDLAWMEQKYGLQPAVIKEDGPAKTYVRLLTELADKDAPAFICHYYNFYFAHTAGGRMIGNKVAGMLLDGQNLEFYQWAGDVNELLEKVRKSINVMAETWSPAQKEHCLAETEASFKYSGVILRCITEAA